MNGEKLGMAATNARNLATKVKYNNYVAINEMSVCIFTEAVVTVRIRGLSSQ